MQSYFIVNNMKVNPFILDDRPFPGFELLAWEKECSTIGTLWDIGDDAGFTYIGKTYVKGQLWITEDPYAIKDIEEFFGVHKGLTEPRKIKVNLHPENPPFQEEIDAIVYQLTNIRNNYRIVEDGHWLIKRQ